MLMMIFCDVAQPRNYYSTRYKADCNCNGILISCLLYYYTSRLHFGWFISLILYYNYIYGEKMDRIAAKHTLSLALFTLRFLLTQFWLEVERMANTNKPRISNNQKITRQKGAQSQITLKTWSFLLERPHHRRRLKKRNKPKLNNEYKTEPYAAYHYQFSPKKTICIKLKWIIITWF